MRRRIHPPPFLIARINARTGGIRDTHVIGRQNPYEVHDNNSQSGYCDNGKGGVSSIIPDKKGGPQPFHRRDLHHPPPQGKTVALKG